MLELPALVVAAALVAVLVNTLVAQAFYIPSESMVPQLHVNDRVVVSKLAYWLHALHSTCRAARVAPPRLAVLPGVPRGGKNQAWMWRAEPVAWGHDDRRAVPQHERDGGQVNDPRFQAEAMSR